MKVATRQKNKTSDKKVRIVATITTEMPVRDLDGFKGQTTEDLVTWFESEAGIEGAESAYWEWEMYMDPIKFELDLELV